MNDNKCQFECQYCHRLMLFREEDGMRAGSHFFFFERCSWCRSSSSWTKVRSTSPPPVVYQQERVSLDNHNIGGFAGDNSILNNPQQQFVGTYQSHINADDCDYDDQFALSRIAPQHERQPGYPLNNLGNNNVSQCDPDLHRKLAGIYQHHDDDYDQEDRYEPSPIALRLDQQLAAQQEYALQQQQQRHSNNASMPTPMLVREGSDNSMRVEEAFLSSDDNMSIDESRGDNSSSFTTRKGKKKRRCFSDDHDMSEMTDDEKLEGSLSSKMEELALSWKSSSFEAVVSSLETNTTGDLTLDGNIVNEADCKIEVLAEAIRSNTTVTSVNIDGNFLERLSAGNQEEIFDAVGSLPRLKCLNVSGFQDSWMKLPLPVLTLALQQATSLEELSLADYTPIGDDEVQKGFIKALRGLKSLTNFKLVDLDMNRPTDLDDVVKALSRLRHLQDVHINFREHLQSADALPHPVSAESVGRLSKDSHFFKMLKKLVLTNIQISDQHVAKFADGLRKNSTLEFVDLSYNRVGNAAGEAIAAALQNNRTLETLCLDGVQLGKAASSKIAAALNRNKTLKSLSIKYNDMEDEDIMAIINGLKANSTLKELFITDNCCRKPNRKVITELLDMLQDNYALQKLEMKHMEPTDQMRIKIIHYLRLNQAGRQRLMQCNSNALTSPSMCHENWVHALTQCQGDLSCIYYFVRAKPDLVQST